jgi:hypothetical protein
MRRIEIGDGLDLGFPGRSADFREGFEIGLLAAALLYGAPTVTLGVSVRAIPEAAELARKLGYSMTRAPEQGSEPDAVDFVFIDKKRLRVVQG